MKSDFTPSLNKPVPGPAKMPDIAKMPVKEHPSMKKAKAGTKMSEGYGSAAKGFAQKP